MNGAKAAAIYAALYAPTVRELTAPLSEVGSRLEARLNELAMRPTPDGAEILALQLEGVRRSVLKLREALIREAEAGGRAADVDK